MSLPKLPDNLPALPYGAVFLGLGERFEKTGSFDGWWLTLSDSAPTWKRGGCSGMLINYYYAAPAGSEIARLNGHVCEPAKPACDSEAVALVRKLAVALNRARGCLGEWPDTSTVVTAAIKEAEAFLAREGKS